MQKLLDAIGKLSEYRVLVEALERGESPVAAGGLGTVHKALVAAALARDTGRPLFLVCPDDEDAKNVAADCASLLGEAVVLPPREFDFAGVEASSREWSHRRIAALEAIRNGACAVASVESASARTLPPDAFRRLRLEITQGMTLDPDALVDLLESSGYAQSYAVEGVGQYSRRGGIVDFYSPSEELPIRIEFWGDEVDTLAPFDPQTQRRGDAAERCLLLPASETVVSAAEGGADGVAKKLRALAARQKEGALKTTLLEDAERFENLRSFPAADRWLDLIYDEFATAMDYLPPDALVVLFEHRRSSERGSALEWRNGEDITDLLKSGKLHPRHAKFYEDINGLYRRATDIPFVYLDSFIGSGYPVPPKRLETFSMRQLPSYGGSLDTAASEVRHYLDAGEGVVLLSADEHRARRLMELLFERGINSQLDYELKELPQPGRSRIALGRLTAGFELPEAGLAVMTEGQIIREGRSSKRKPAKKSAANRVKSYADLTAGDYVVHDDYGIAQFVGIETLEVDGAKRDYAKLRFLGTDVLYLPATRLDVISKYIGAGEATEVRLSKMGGAEWKRSKSRAKAAAKELAGELIKLYAARARTEGVVCEPDDAMQREFEERFEFDETPDQLAAVKEIKRDMERPVPMDRLLCGDVGFGKTEVALRAAMKCILSGMQAAILVPTTVLAQQHYLTASRRFAGFAANIEVMSRFRTPAELKRVAAATAAGQVDLLIGTHRILQKDVSFKKLGLLIVDEEQRFGVMHKERLKEISRGVDVLTLSATPIPRTLNMALSGIRDMSVLEDPPRDRLPVQTYVLEQDRAILTEAMRREIGRGGQVYYLHNRVETIDRTAARIREDLGGEESGIVVATAHGQMSEKELGDVMDRVERGEVQVLVCTTIIETGIDIPNVNTLIVEDADRYGLAQLHQIRGRVGRSRRRAYAYLCYRKGKALSDIAEKRLTAIREFAEFGAGFKIAMRDLEIRGAGNLLGAAQSGHLNSVGYDMYLKLLEDAVLEERGEKPKSAGECTADLAVEARIPESYIANSGERMDLYRRMALARTEDEASELIDELCDRYGDLPREVYALLRVALLRAKAGAAGIREIAQKGDTVRFYLDEEALRSEEAGAVSIEAVSRVCTEPKYRSVLRFEAGRSRQSGGASPANSRAPGAGRPALALKLPRGADVLDAAEKFVDELIK